MLTIDSDFIWKRSLKTINDNGSTKYSSNIICKPLDTSENQTSDWVITIDSNAYDTIVPYAPFRTTDWHKSGPKKSMNVGQYNDAKLDTAPFELSVSTRRARIGRYGRKNRKRGPYKPITKQQIEIAEAFGEKPADYEEMKLAATMNFVDTDNLNKSQLRHYALHTLLSQCMVNFTEKYGFLFDIPSITLLSMTEEAMQIGWVVDYAHNLMVDPLPEFIDFRIEGYKSLERVSVKRIEAEEMISKFIKQKLVFHNELSFSQFTMAPTARPKHLLGALWATLANHLEQKTVFHSCKDVFSPCNNMINLTRDSRRTVCSNNCNNMSNHYVDQDKYSGYLASQWKKHYTWKQQSIENRKSPDIMI